MLQINEIAVKELATLAGIDESKLKSELFVDADKAPTETKIKDLLASTVIMPKKDHETLMDNHGKGKFDEGKHQQTNQLLKVVLGDKAFEATKDTKREEVADKIKSILKSEWDLTNKVEPNEKVKTLEDEKAKLQLLVSETKTELEKMKGEYENTKTFSIAEKKVASAVAAIPFSAKGEILSKQREVIEKNILSSYQHKIEDGVSVWYKDNIKQVDNLQNPKSIEEIAKGEAIIFPTTSSDNGRGDDSSNSNINKSGSLDAELAKLTTNADFAKFLSERRLSPLSDEGKALMSKWMELKAKKA